MTRMTASLTADVLVVDLVTKKVLTVQRKNPPFEEKFAFPGGFVDEGESFLDAAVREAKEETGLNIFPYDLIPLTIRDDPNRDPRGRVVTQPYVLWRTNQPAVVPADDAKGYMWWPIHYRGLAFDHDAILQEVLDKHHFV